MRLAAASTAAILLLLTPALNAQKIVFSHRVYAARGRTYQQLWIWSADTGGLTQVSHTPRDHRLPICEADGRWVIFDEGEDTNHRTRWRLDRTSGVESARGPADTADRPQRPRAAPPECDADTAHASPDGGRVACTVKGTGILVADSHTFDHAVRVPFDPRYSTGEPYPPWPMDVTWSPDARTLLVGNYGENGSSTSSQLDYFLLDLSTNSWRRAFTGTDALWVAPRLIVYVTPRDLSPLPGSQDHSVWTAHLTAFDPVTLKSAPITSGVSNDLTPALCLP